MLLPFFFLSFLKIRSPSSIPVAVRTLGFLQQGALPRKPIRLEKVPMQVETSLPAGGLFVARLRNLLVFPTVALVEVAKFKTPLFAASNIWNMCCRRRHRSFLFFFLYPRGGSSPR